MRVLVTGGTGFTGSALVARLLGEGHDVVSLDCRPGLRDAELKTAGATLVTGSIVDPGVVDECMRDVEVVHHVAAAFREHDVPESHYDSVNVDGTRIVLEAAVRHGIRRFVNCSTGGVYGLSTTHLSAACGLVPTKPRVRHLARAERARIRAEDRPRRRPAPYGGMVRGPGISTRRLDEPGTLC